MDEMQLVRGLRPSRAPASPRETANARRRLETAIRKELDSLGLSNPLALVARRRRRLRKGALWGSAAASLVALVFITLVPSSRFSSAHADAEEALTAAANAARQLPVLIGPGEYRYSKSRTANLATMFDPRPYSVLVSAIREIWIASDGSGYMQEVRERPSFPGEEDRRRWLAQGRPDFGSGVHQKRFGVGGLYFEDLRNLPTDADELYPVIRSRATSGGNSTDAAMLTLVGDLLRETAAPPDLRQALYEVAARIPSVELVGKTTDALGRTGTTVAIEEEIGGTPIRTELMFDHETSELLSQRKLLLERVNWVDQEPPVTIAYTLHVASRTVDSLPSRPLPSATT